VPDVSSMQDQINSHQSQVDMLESELDTANNTISDLQKALALLESTVAGLDVAAVEGRVTDIETILTCVSYDPIYQVFSSRTATTKWLTGREAVA